MATVGEEGRVLLKLDRPTLLDGETFLQLGNGEKVTFPPKANSSREANFAEYAEIDGVRTSLTFTAYAMY